MARSLERATVFDHAPDAIFVMRDDGTVLDVNRRACSFLGYERDEIIGHSVTEFVAPDHRADSLRRLDRVAHGAAPDPVHRVFLCKDGRRVPGAIRLTVLDRPDGGRVVVSIVRDVTDQFGRAQARAEQSLRLQSLGMLAGGIAHDFNNILASIVGFGELAREQVEPDSDVARDIERALKAADQARRLVEQILRFGRHGSGARAPIDLEQAVVGIIRIVRSTLPPGTELSVASDHSSTLVLGDETRLQQVVLNLCANAGKALGERQGAVRITLETVDLTADRPVSSQLAPGKYVALSVHDDGPGVPEEIRDWIFEPYFSTRDGAGGTGLGLSVVRSIVEDHNGVISLEESERGAHFRVLLPAYEGEPPARTAASASAIQRLRGTALVLDDEPEIVEIVTRHLSAAGLTVMASADVHDALQLVRTWGGEIDVIVTDESMPVMRGTEFVERVRLLGCEAPALVVTGAAPVAGEDELERLGIVGVAGKPVARGELVAMVADALGSRKE